jgi:hypothetical protein
MMCSLNRGFGVMIILDAALASASLFGQQPTGSIPWQGTPAAPAAPAAPMLSMEQLTSLVAPVALYPDPLLAQVLAASTYPLEIVEAQQWLQQNRNLAGAQLMQAARQQNWDASVQALTAFPDAMALLSRDIRWTTDLGNAFLSQQQDVMNAIQMLRARAQSNGQLVSGPQQAVTTQAQNGQSAIEIQPANPQVMYVPTYAPQAVWGPGVAAGYGDAAPIYAAPAYAGPAYQGGWSSFGGIGGPAIRFGAGVLLRTLFSGALQSGLGFGGWGWALNWLVHAVFLNPLFFHNNGFGGYGSGGFGGYTAAAWVHNPVHRLGVAYPNSGVAARFDSGYGRNGYRSQTARYGSHYSTPYAASYAGREGYSHFAGSNYGGNYGSRPAASEYRPAASDYRSATSDYRAAGNGYRSYESFAPQRSAEKFSQPKQSTQYYASSSYGKGGGHYSAPKTPHSSAPKAPHYSAPKAPHFSGGHSGGGHSGKSKHH